MRSEIRRAATNKTKCQREGRAVRPYGSHTSSKDLKSWSLLVRGQENSHKRSKKRTEMVMKQREKGTQIWARKIYSNQDGWTDRQTVFSQSVNSVMTWGCLRHPHYFPFSSCWISIIVIAPHKCHESILYEPCAIFKHSLKPFNKAMHSQVLTSLLNHVINVMNN